MNRLTKVFASTVVHLLHYLVKFKNEKCYEFLTCTVIINNFLYNCMKFNNSYMTSHKYHSSDYYQCLCNNQTANADNIDDIFVA